jgi:hypothetical protein
MEEREVLERLATAIDSAQEEIGWYKAGPALLRIVGELDPAIELGIRPIDKKEHVVDMLAGFTAPEDWTAIGCVTLGNARHVDDPDVAQRVRVVHLVARSGESASVMRLQGQEANVMDDRGTGRIDDCCRRALGLTTDPPPDSTLELWATVWLDKMMLHPPSTWEDAVDVHPAIVLLRADVVPESAIEAARQEMDLIGRTMAASHDWPALRLACARGEWPVEDVPPRLAEWLDDGAFARWTLGTMPKVADALTLFRAVTPDAVGDKVTSLLEGWGVLGDQ